MAWLAWWVLLMALWVWVDDSVLAAELGVGAAVAAIAASLVELAQHQAAIRVRLRSSWLASLAGLPLQVGRDFLVVMGALVARLVRGRVPPSGFERVGVDARGEGAEARTKRALVLGLASIAPNTFALGVEEDGGHLIVHRLVLDRRRAGRAAP